MEHVSADEVPLDLCSARSYLEVPLARIKKSSNEESLAIDSSADAVPLERAYVFVR